MKTVENVLLVMKANCAWRRQFYKSFLLILLTAVSAGVYAQSSTLETDKGLEEAIASYNANERQSILIASENPAVLSQLQKSQDQTMDSFQEMISRFRQQKQEWFYTITRYPALMHQLANLPARQSQEDIKKLLPNQDPELQEAAWKLYRHEKENLAKLDNINMNANKEFENSTSHLNASAQEAFRQLQNKPDVLTLLTNNIDLTTRLGERYKNNPATVSNELAVLHDKLELQNQREAAAFKKQMESNSKAMKELQQASNAYRSNSYYNNPYYSPYSYWFGYPYWYSYPMWYPAMGWYYPGFSFGIGGLYGFPSYGFSYWFYNGGYYMQYPHLYRELVTYYRTNVAATHLTTPASRGFVNVATTHYSPMSARTSTLSSPYTYRQQSGIQQRVQVQGVYHGGVNSNFYHAPSVGGFGRSGFIGGTVGGGLHGGGRGR